MCHEFEGKAPGPVHPSPTTRRRLCYFFHPKHHNPANKTEAQWLPVARLSHQQEFDIFDRADDSQIEDHDGNLYGVRPNMEVLGTYGQRVARFWKEESSHPWHGHPICPIKVRDTHRLFRPVPREALDKMMSAKLISATQHRRLVKGK
jgi:hypothetical protein